MSSSIKIKNQKITACNKTSQNPKITAYNNVRFAVFLDDFERVELNVTLNAGVVPRSPDEPFHVEHCVFGIRCELVLRRVADETFALRSEGHVRGCNAVALIVRDYLHAAAAIYSNTTS